MKIIRLKRGDWSRIAACAAAGALAGAGYFGLAPRWYTSTLTIMPAKTSGIPGLPSLKDSSGLLDLPLPGSGNDADRIAAVLESTSVTDAVIGKFSLLERYGAKYLEMARREVWKHCAVRVITRGDLVSLTCEDKDPRFVQAMLAHFGEYGNEVFKRVNRSAASEEVHFLEEHVADLREEADTAAQRLRDFEQKNGIVDLEAQGKAVVSTLEALRAQEISKRLELSYMKGFSAQDESSAVELRRQIAILDREQRLLGSSDDSVAPRVVDRARKRAGTGDKDFFPPPVAVPDLRLELTRLTRESKALETSLLLSVQHLEIAKANEARETSAFHVLDPPALPTYKSRPRGSVALFAGILLGLLAGLVWRLGPPVLRSLHLSLYEEDDLTASATTSSPRQH